jgi:hypothetical protein
MDHTQTSHTDRTDAAPVGSGKPSRYEYIDANGSDDIFDQGPAVWPDSIDEALDGLNTMALGPYRAEELPYTVRLRDMDTLEIVAEFAYAAESGAWVRVR